MRVTASNNQVSNNDVKSSQGASKAAAAEKAKKSSKSNSSSSTGETGDVKMNISSEAKEFARAKQIASEAPDVREAKIAELKRRIAEGKYKVEAEAVADKMITEHLQTSGLD